MCVVANWSCHGKRRSIQGRRRRSMAGARRRLSPERRGQRATSSPRTSGSRRRPPMSRSSTHLIGCVIEARRRRRVRRAEDVRVRDPSEVACSRSATISWEPALHVAEAHELEAVDRQGVVWLSGRGAESQGLGRSILAPRRGRPRASVATRRGTAICHRLHGCPIRSDSESKIARAVLHGGHVARFQRRVQPVVVGMEECSRVAELVGEVARLGGPTAAQVECPGHGDRLVAVSDGVDQCGVVVRRRAMPTAWVAIDRRSSKSALPGDFYAQQREETCPVRAVRVAQLCERTSEHRRRGRGRPLRQCCSTLGCCASAAWTRVSIASISSARRPAASKVSRCAGSPGCLCASPKPEEERGPTERVVAPDARSSRSSASRYHRSASSGASCASARSPASCA